MEKKNIAGMSMKGGKKDNFFFCLLEYFPKKERWFLNSLLQVKEHQEDEDDVIRNDIIFILLCSDPCSMYSSSVYLLDFRCIIITDLFLLNFISYSVAHDSTSSNILII